MGQKRFLSVIGMVLAIMGLVSISLCIFQQGENQVLLWLGLMCNSIAFLLYCIANRKKNNN